MEKILIIGQAPPAITQSVPYDSTMLYEILSWVGVSKEEAQKKFDFDSVSNVFNGHGANGHNKPTTNQMDTHWKDTLETKVQGANKVWLLGNVAKEYFHSKPKTWSCSLEILETIHPSKRNYSRIIKQKKIITDMLNKFLNG